VALPPRVFCNCGFEYCRQHGRLSIVSVVCCQIEVSAMGWLIVQRIPTDCGVSESDREASTIIWPWPTGGCSSMKTVCIKISSKTRTNNPHYTLQNYISYTYEKALLNKHSHLHIQSCVTYVFESVFKLKKYETIIIESLDVGTDLHSPWRWRSYAHSKRQVTHYPVGRRHIPEERRAQLTFQNGLIDCCFVRLVTSYVETAF
jgi:hypothetical protein